MIRTTRWRPDTCSCEIDYSWDDSLPLDQVIFKLHKVNRACNAHAGVTDAFVTALEENQRKNYSLGEILDRFSKVRIGDSAGYSFKIGMEPKWAFTVSRVLQIDMGNNLTGAEKNTLRTTLNTRFGVGKVQVI